MSTRWNDRRALVSGTRVGSYRVVGAAMRGGFAAVYQGECERDGSIVAIKVLDDPSRGGRRAVERFALEVEAIQRVRHPGIVAILDQGTLEDDRPYYVMEWLEGHSLEDELGRRGPLAPVDALPILAQLCAALEAAHGAGVAHRDLKPANIMVVEHDEHVSIKLLDFGIAKLVGQHDAEQGLTTTSIALGTVHYMAPEQILCRAIDHRADIYALGVLIYRLVTGALPFDGPTRLVVQMRHLDDPPPLASQLSSSAAVWDRVIQACMSKEPADRPQSVESVMVALRAALDARSVQPVAGKRAWLQLELDGRTGSRAQFNARTAAMVRAMSWMHASGWQLVMEADNALLGEATLDAHPRGDAAALLPLALVDGAHRFVETFGWRRLPWAASAELDTRSSASAPHGSGFIARAWIWPSDGAPPPDTMATPVPSGVYVSRAFMDEAARADDRAGPGIPGFISIER